MGLFSGLNIGGEALKSQATAMNVIADNLANSDTIGFKEGRAEFQDILANSIGGLYDSPIKSGNGVGVNDIATLQTQGPVDFTSRPLDVAINGKGFFIFNTGTDTFYSRAGNFSTDSLGNIVSATGEQVMGYTAASADTLVALNISTISSTAAPTTTATLTGNLDDSVANTTVPAAPATFTALNSAASFRGSVGVKDALGASHEISLYFFKTAPLTWQVDAYVPASDVGGTGDTPTSLGTAAVSFAATGTQPAGQTVTMSVSPAWTNGAQASAITLDFSAFTGFAAPSNIASITADGKAAGQVTGISFGTDGTVYAVLEDGAQETVGALGLANFANPEGLDRVGDNKFRETTDSGTASAGRALTEGRGLTQGGALEQSTVDMASEFIQMISTQRAYQAGAKIISTSDSLLNTTIQLA